jgi:hypothetical protein
MAIGAKLAVLAFPVSSVTDNHTRSLLNATGAIVSLG